MKLNNLLFGVTVLALSFVALSSPARAGSIDLNTSGTLGPVISGIDPLHLNGGNFLVTGSIDQNTAPISITADSATYSIPGNLDVSVGTLVFSGFYGTMTLTDPSSGPDTLAFSFMVSDLGFVPVVTATMSLPEGTLNGTGLQEFSADVSQPDSVFAFQLLGVSTAVTGALGITGVTSATLATSPSAVPEPGTLGSLAGGLLAFTLVRRRAGARATK